MFSRTLVLTFGSLALASLSLSSTPVATTVEAQALRNRFQGMDRNNDGIITRDEWRGSPRSFENHDWNGDGRLSGEEVRPGARRMQEWEQADHGPNWRERNLSWTKGGFTNLDHDRDGRLTPNEWHYDPESFRRADQNNDNALTLPEFLGENWDDDRGDNFDDLDYNNDGFVVRDEWHGGNQEFRALDRNNDGRLSRFEVVGSQPPLTKYDEFADLDFDRSGTITRNEWHWSNVSFNQRDTNRDGTLSRAEYNAGGGSPAVGAIGQASQSVTVNSQHRWTDTGITVRAGDVLTLNASGEIRMSDNPADVASPAGARSGRTAPDAPVLGQLAGGLLAKIGTYPPMWVGGQGSVTAPVSGRLYLGVNDDHLLDNAGSFTVQIGIQRR
ncbi:MAG TPA: hypothetical protein VEC39_02780 [Vicinamibacterales bacterium]|nr:hypothetical protein [Vicinamibacterales bacterium]